MKRTSRQPKETMPVADRRGVCRGLVADRRLCEIRRKLEAGFYDRIPPTLPVIVDGVLEDLIHGAAGNGDGR